jgi:hypothetical protein
VSGDRALLILTSEASLYSVPLARDIELLARAGQLAGVATALLPLESPLADTFLTSNPWIEDDQTYPYVIVYRRGLRVEGFTAFSAGYLIDRLDRLALIPVEFDGVAVAEQLAA